MINADKHYLTKSAIVRATGALVDSPGLVIVDIEPLYSLSSHTERAIEILVFMGVFMITLGVIIYTLIARTFFISPIRIDLRASRADHCGLRQIMLTGIDHVC